MQKKLIAAAVAGALVAPTVMADEHVSVTPYGRIANALDFTDVDGGDSTMDLRNVSSRIGLKGSTDLGNGMTVFGHYEFATFTDVEGADGGRGGIVDTRIAKVGMSGSFGSIAAGQQWSAFYNHAGVHMDPTYTLGYVVYSSQMGGPYRQSNAVSYSNSFGPVSLQVDSRFSTDSAASGADTEKLGGDNGEDLDGLGIGATFTVTDNLSLAAAYDVESFAVGDDVERMGLAASASFGNVWGSVGYMTTEQESAGIDNELMTAYLGSSIGENSGAYIGYQGGDNSATEPSAILLHADHAVAGGPLKLFYEGALYDFDGAQADRNTHLVGMRIDF